MSHSGPMAEPIRKCRPLLHSLRAPDILDSIADGVYVTDTNRQIVFWNKGAERITGWPASDVVGRSCFDNILIHEDKDGHALCGEEFCPLHRAIISDAPSQGAVLVYAKTKPGARVPVEVSVSPIHDDEGTVVGGVEVFRDLSASEEDLRCAQLIQKQTLDCALPEDPRFEFGIRYVPHDLIGGDFYRLEAAGRDRYACLVADVMGHGVSAALYTMQLRVLWEDLRPRLDEPAAFFGLLNSRLAVLARPNGYFATAIFLLLDAATGALRYVNAGHPAPIVLRKNGQAVFLEEHGPGLGLFDGTDYPEGRATLEVGDTLVAYTDGATEIFNAAGAELDEPGLVRMLKRCGIGKMKFHFDRLEEELLRYSTNLRLPDDLTLVRMRRRG